MADATKAFGPGELSTTDPKRSVVSTESMANLQQYVTHALQLPETEDKMRILAAIPSSDNIDNLKPLMNVFKSMQDHCTDWQNNIYPTVVNLADDLVQYGGRVATFYTPLVDIAKKWETGAQPTEADLNTFKAVLVLLQKDTGAKATAAKTVADSITVFSTVTAQDKVNLDFQKQFVDSEFGLSSQKVKDLAASLQQARDEAADEAAEYTKDWIIAATAPSYQFMGFIGFAVATAIEGVYGAKAEKARAARNAALEQAKTLEAQEETSLRIQTETEIIVKKVASTQSDITAALTTIQLIQGQWQAINSDLGNILTTLTKDVSSAVSKITSYLLQEAMDNWVTVKENADNFRLNAFVTVNVEALSAVASGR